jgi:hypothetical protein
MVRWMKVEGGEEMEENARIKVKVGEEEEEEVVVLLR